MARTGDRPPLRFPLLMPALRRVLADGYGAAELRADVLAGCVVGVVAVPLSMALAIASGMAPAAGLHTAVVAGLVAALFGGSRFQVTGPTAAFVVLLAPLTAEHGPAGLATASLLAGVALCLFAWARVGRAVEFVPYPVVSGFTAGIGVVIATLQLPAALGLPPAPPEGWLATVEAVASGIGHARAAEWSIAVLVLLVLWAWPKLDHRLPPALVALSLAGLAAWALERFLPGLDVVTLADRFGTPAAPHGVPAEAPRLALPWNLPGPDGGPAPGLSLAFVRALLPAALAIAFLGAIESLLSATVADGMTGTRHDPDAELVGQGLANLAAPLLGGFAATGAIARTATGVRSGARSPVAAAVHSGFVLGAVLAIAPLLGALPLAGLAGLLLRVAWNVAEPRHVWRMVRSAPRSDVAVLATCATLTVVFDMTVAVPAGIALASLLFMRRMAEMTGAELVANGEEGALRAPADVLVYAIRGPLFFGAASKAMGQVALGTTVTRAVVLDLSAVPAIDATGLANLASAAARLRRRGVRLTVAGAQAGPQRALARAHERGALPDLHLAPSVAAALAELGRPDAGA